MSQATQLQSGISTIPGGIEVLVILAFVVPFILLPIAGMSEVMRKTGKPGWIAIAPIYNVYVLTRIADIGWWWALISVIPYLNVIALVRVTVAVAQAFGKSRLFGFAAGIFPFIGWPLLGFGSAEYQA